MPKAGTSRFGGDREVCRGEPQRPSSRIPRDDYPLDLERTAEQLRGLVDAPLVEHLPNAGRRDALEELDRSNLEPVSEERVEVASPAAPEAEVLARDDDLRVDRPQHFVCELDRVEPGQIEREVDDERFVDPEVCEQLQPALERREQIDAVSEGGSRMRVEGDDRRPEAGVARGLDDPAMAQVHPVEGAQGYGAWRRLELGRGAGDLHSSANASSGGITRCSSASSILNGPTAVRLSDTQWPPRASARERT